MEDIKIGKYRHFKGNEYEVIELPSTVKHLLRWSYIRLFTVTAVFGCAPLKCGTKQLSATEKYLKDLLILENDYEKDRKLYS